ncbi:uncharacterized protein L969DRAFT_322779 [Mixia osmundae IAM 14324]|uniref:Phospholipase n=1 Tax=Mixia osmundae (strain CBS 9802 / IAM 14324 / JCM 22182 / KY 12970) TaxID=764103 RepID=G7DTR5_MIXOS|nr:uncharacterized protein L969DRAFT_322779 [Mixia osmundae IAM 14324]KEI41691.1 hypothetical protein L969DRAFT_322779 [Mixia osmundae IAM 14324]GAA93975.1 hypothetical protein E5Q_00622 [Mixia osmundae IAM 14324]
MAPFSKLRDRARDITSDIGQDFGRLTTAASYAFNPDHRHDEAHEKEADRKQAEICASHRFNSFAAQRQNNNVKWFVDGKNYFWALSEILEEAKESIMILDWWLTPELYLRRPPADHEEYRLDRLLKRKAEEGVKIYIVVYKEVTASMSMGSKHTKNYLESLHPNILVFRHPDHSGGEVVLRWSHHEKVVIADCAVACIGGLDICFGRWDTSTLQLADCHPQDFTRQLFPGQDYNDARIADFVDVAHWLSNQQSRLTMPRMPWHDVHTMLAGPVVLDIAQHFVERWNFIRFLKYRGGHQYHVLAFPHHPLDEMPDESVHRHPHLDTFMQGVHYYKHALDRDETQMRYGGNDAKGNMNVQVLRSSADWSHGILTEHSIKNAYLQLIREANHFIYIENQFFVSSGQSDSQKGPIKNEIAAAIAQRCISAAKDGKKFKVIIVIPCVPGFAGDLNGSEGTLSIIHFTYQALCRGKDSIYGQIEAAGFNPRDYCQIFHLRSYDRLPSDPKLIDGMESRSGVSFAEAQAALARIYMGDNTTKTEATANSIVKIAQPSRGESLAPGETQPDQVIEVKTPATVKEAHDTLRRWHDAAPSEPPNPHVKNSVAHHAMRRSGGSLRDEPWYGDEESELEAFVTEESYIHSKLMIVDDRIVLCGSANINDRSQQGDRDSEIACVTEDTNMIESKMAGERYMASQFAASFRRQLMKYHLGIMPPQDCPSESDPDPGMRPVDVEHDREFISLDDALVEDPLSEDFDKLWRGTAKSNTERFRKVFHCVPDDTVTNWDEYKAFVPKAPVRVGHVAEGVSLETVKEELDGVRGHLVEMPIDFLSKEDLLGVSVAVNPATIEIYT